MGVCKTLDKYHVGDFLFALLAEHYGVLAVLNALGLKERVPLREANFFIHSRVDFHLKIS